MSQLNANKKNLNDNSVESSKYSKNQKILVFHSSKSIKDLFDLAYNEICSNGYYPFTNTLDIIYTDSFDELNNFIFNFSDISDKNELVCIYLMTQESNFMQIRDFAKSLRDDSNLHFTRINLIVNNVKVLFKNKTLSSNWFNDFILQSDLNMTRLFSSIISSSKGYYEILENKFDSEIVAKVISSSYSLIKVNSLSDLYNKILFQIGLIFNLSNQKGVKTTSGFIATRDNASYKIECGIGEHRTSVLKDISTIKSDDFIYLFNTARYSNSKYSFNKNSLVFIFNSIFDKQNIIYITLDTTITFITKQLITIYLENLSISFNKLYLDLEIQSAQKELIYSLGDVAEFRSEETGNHVKRVAEYSYLIATKYGLTEKESEMIKISSPLHDIGKIAIPDSILKKPGKLTPEEFEIMKTHTTLGYNILKNSNGDLMTTGSVIALQHHEKFDGTGYPNGLLGYDIHIAARIVAVADVFDALGSKRVYKEAWDIQDILKLFIKEKGKHFDPLLIDILFNNLDEVLHIKNSYSD